MNNTHVHVWKAERKRDREKERAWEIVIENTRICVKY